MLLIRMIELDQGSNYWSCWMFDTWICANIALLYIVVGSSCAY
jgi:hypothetical protein